MTDTTADPSSLHQQPDTDVGAVDTRAMFRHLLTPQGLADPYVIYRQIRAQEEAGAVPNQVVVRHQDAIEVLGDSRMSSDRIDALVDRLEPAVQRDVAPVVSTLRAIIAFRDPPGHTRVRRLMTVALKARAVRRQREVIQQAAILLLGRIVSRGGADIHAELTYPLPSMVVAGILGVPDADRGRFEQWANDVVFFVGSGALNEDLARQTLISMTQMHEYLAELVAQRRAEPRDDLLTAMVEAADGEDGLTDEEVHANALFLMTAGHETATNMLSNGLLTLLRNPEQLDLLRRDPDLIDQCVEEILRYESPVQMTPRLAPQGGIDIAGRHLDGGDAVVVVLGAANRDPAVFDQPDTFAIQRDDGRHLAFAHGAHWCIGGALAREEARIVLPLVLDRLPDLALGTLEISWQPTLNFRGPTALPVTWST